MAEETVVELDDVFNTISNNLVDETIPSHNEVTELEDDDVLSLDIDQEELSKLEAELCLAAGVYIWDKVPTIRRVYSDKDSQPSDLMQQMYKSTGDTKYNKGRLIVNVSGLVINRETLKKGRFQFGFSPDYREYTNKETGAKSGEADPLSKTYASLTTFYFQKYEKKIKNVKDILTMLEECTYTMYITMSKTTNSNYLGRLQKL